MVPTTLNIDGHEIAKDIAFNDESLAYSVHKDTIKGMRFYYIREIIFLILSVYIKEGAVVHKQ